MVKDLAHSECSVRLAVVTNFDTCFEEPLTLQLLALPETVLFWDFSELLQSLTVRSIWCRGVNILNENVRQSGMVIYCLGNIDQNTYPSFFAFEKKEILFCFLCRNRLTFCLCFVCLFLKFQRDSCLQRGKIKPSKSPQNILWGVAPVCVSANPLPAWRRDESFCSHLLSSIHSSKELTLSQGDKNNLFVNGPNFICLLSMSNLIRNNIQHSKGHYLLRSYFIQDTLLKSLHASHQHVVSLPVFSYIHSIDEDTNTWRGEIICPRSQMYGYLFNP